MRNNGYREFRDKKILVIDDEALMCQLIKSIFQAEGASVIVARSGVEGLKKFTENDPDLVLLDVVMPGEDGFMVCKRIREKSSVPVIFLTAMNRGEEVVNGLDSGADDYVTKPFEREVLLARTRAVMRRPQSFAEGNDPRIYDNGYLRIDLSSRSVSVDGKPVKLSATEYKLLVHLLRNADQTCTFSDILENVWGEAYSYSSEYVHVYIWHLRQKLESNPKQPNFLVTEHGVGYRLNMIN